MANLTFARDAATTTVCRTKHWAHRCRTCGQPIRDGQKMTSVRFWYSNSNRLGCDWYHAECAPAFTEPRVVLHKPGFDWDEICGSNGSIILRLKPCNVGRLVDMGGWDGNGDGIALVAWYNRRNGFLAQATYSTSAHRNLPANTWHTRVRGGGAGSTRYNWFPTEEQARQHLASWFKRRYRYAEEVLPPTE